MSFVVTLGQSLLDLPPGIELTTKRYQAESSDYSGMSSKIEIFMALLLAFLKFPCKKSCAICNQLIQKLLSPFSLFSL